MINCNIGPLGGLCAQLKLYELVGSDTYHSDAELRQLIDDGIRPQLEGWLGIANDLATEFEWKAVHDRVSVFREKLTKRFRRRDLGTEARVLLEAIHAGLKWQFIYRYPQEKNALLRQWLEDWEPAIQAFPSAKNDILVGIDLWALSHPTPSVFQFMRVLEFGLRALADEVGRTFDRQQWHNIIEEIESSIETFRKTGPRGTEKDDRLNWLSQAAKEFFYFKDGWRNYAAHGRANYDECQARSVMEHVRTFMNHLATRLSE